MYMSSFHPFQVAAGQDCTNSMLISLLKEANKTNVFQSPLIFACNESTFMCMLDPQINWPKDGDDLMTNTSQHHTWGIFAVEDLVIDEIIVDILKENMMSNGSLLYCSSHEVEKPGGQIVQQCCVTEASEAKNITVVYSSSENECDGASPNSSLSAVLLVLLIALTLCMILL